MELEKIGPVNVTFPKVGPSSAPEIFDASSAALNILPSVKAASTEIDASALSFDTLVDLRQSANTYPLINTKGTFQGEIEPVASEIAPSPISAPISVSKGPIDLYVTPQNVVDIALPQPLL